MARDKLTPEQRALRARANAHSSWAKTEDRAARTAKAREAAMGRFEREVDPDGRLDPAERAKRADNAKRAYYADLALRSSKKRKRK